MRLIKVKEKAVGRAYDEKWSIARTRSQIQRSGDPNRDRAAGSRTSVIAVSLPTNDMAAARSYSGLKQALTCAQRARLWSQASSVLPVDLRQYHLLRAGLKEQKDKLMTIPRRNRKRIAASCLGVWLFAFTIGVAHACGMLPAAHALEMSHSLVQRGEADDGDEDVGCDKACVDGAPPAAELRSLQGFFATQAFVVQTWTDSLVSSIAVRAKAANRGGGFYSGAPPPRTHVRLTL